MPEYKFGLGKDRRLLTRYHTKAWMDYVVSCQKPRYGEKNGYCKLSAAQVKEIRSDHVHTGVELAKQFGVTKAHIYRIKKRKSRKRG